MVLESTTRRIIDASPVVWARDLGAAKDRLLMSYYPKRAVWEMDAPQTRSGCRN